MCKRILLSNNEWTLVSNEDYLFLVGFNWSTNGNSYAQRKVKCVSIYMHHIVAERMKLDLSNEIDHINGITLDNRRCNLRAATSSQNSYNTRRAVANSTGYQGVSKHRNKWCAEIHVNGERVWLGNFDTPEEASFAYQEAIKCYHGEFVAEENDNV